ncbi:hypothetical protein [Neotabrizicola shimadae]|uniref:Uncharacterized protein n=1 Tax=Neotabrizicola shimadae TaxID=2807096 RepID=A0A8G1ECE0_9RHOB|nr:hypothetical protein [Neotabrizicola shimadae]QYZ70332.1 hypothetical protein JO391_02010 [Neotabrizicola shimadae]
MGDPVLQIMQRNAAKLADDSIGAMRKCFHNESMPHRSATFPARRAT